MHLHLLGGKKVISFNDWSVYEIKTKTSFKFMNEDEVREDPKPKYKTEKGWKSFKPTLSFYMWGNWFLIGYQVFQGWGRPKAHLPWPQVSAAPTCFSPLWAGAEAKSLEHREGADPWWALWKRCPRQQRRGAYNTSQPFSSTPDRHHTFSNDTSADTGVPFWVNKWGSLRD